MLRTSRARCGTRLFADELKLSSLAAVFPVLEPADLQFQLLDNSRSKSLQQQGTAFLRMLAFLV